MIGPRGRGIRSGRGKRGVASGIVEEKGAWLRVYSERNGRGFASESRLGAWLMD